MGPSGVLFFREKRFMELDMTKGSPSKLITKFIIPIIIGNIFQQLYSMVDTIIVGRFIGVDALAAVGATGSVSFLILGFTQGLTTGFTVLTAQRFGAGDREGMRKSIGSAAILSVIVTIVMTAVSMAGMDSLLRVMNTPEDIFDMTKEYIMIICAGIACNVLYNLLSSILRAIGNSVVPLVLLVIASVTNIVLDYVLIVYGHMGVGGAAYATIISQGLSGVLCLIYIIKSVPTLQIRPEHCRLESQCEKAADRGNSHGTAVFHYSYRHHSGTGSTESAGFYRGGILFCLLQGGAAGDTALCRNGGDYGNLLCAEPRYQ